MGFQVDHCDGPHLVLRHVRLYHHRQLLRWCVSHHALVQCNISMHGTRTFRGVLVAGMCVCMLAAFVRGVALEPGPRVLPAPLTHATPLSTHTHTHTGAVMVMMATFLYGSGFEVCKTKQVTTKSATLPQ